MAKYIINVPDEILEFMNGKFNVFIEPEVKVGECRHYKVRLDDTEVTPYTETDKQSVNNNNIHLCWSCQNSYPECPIKNNDVLFGDGVGNDNICCCNAYRPTESNASDEDEIRQMAHEEAWEFARRIICPSECCEDSISAHTKEIFNKEGWEIRGVFKDLSYQEAKTKYEEWGKEKRRIHVGDEVRHTLTSAIGVIMQIMDLTIMWEDGSVREDRGEHIEKTGRHFDDVESLLKKMREGETDGKVYY